MCLYLRTTQQTCTKHHSMITNDYYVKMSQKHNKSTKRLENPINMIAKH